MTRAQSQACAQAFHARTDLRARWDLFAAAMARVTDRGWAMPVDEFDHAVARVRASLVTLNGAMAEARRERDQERAS
jgi:hypothetical protein